MSSLFAPHSPMFGNSPSPQAMLDFNVGLFNGDPMTAMLGNMGIGQVMGAAGLMPSQFMATQNFYDQYLNKRFYQQQNAAMSDAAQADRATYVSTLRGIARMAGTPRMSLDQEKAAQSLAGGIAAAAPILAQLFPEAFDQLHGTRGSATVMASGIFRGGRIAQDSATGLTGLEGRTAGAVASQIQSRFFGPGADISAFRGLSMGRLGMLYEEMQGRGLGGASIASYDPSRQLDMVGQSPDLIAGAFDTLKGSREARDVALHDRLDKAGLVARVRAGGDDGRLAAREAAAQIRADSPEAFDDVKRQFDARKVGDRLKNLSGAVSAMRDIFGDMGRPNAPMKELVEGLNQLTQGGLATMSTAQLEKSVRVTQSLARTTGLGMEGMMALMARGAGITDQLGIERQFGVQASQGAAAFGQAFGQVGRGDVAHFQARDAETMTLLDQRLRAQAANSGMANQLNTALRLADTREGLGGPAKALADAIKAGKTTFARAPGAAEESIFQDEKDFRSLMMDSGVAEGDLGRVAMQRATNRQYGAKYNTADLARQAQAGDIKGFFAQAQRSSMVDVLGKAGIEGDEAERLALTAGNAAADALMKMDAGDRRDDRKRTRATADAMRASLGEAGKKLSDADLLAAADSGFGAFNESVRRNPRLRGYETGLVAIEVNDERTLKRQREVTEENRIDAAMRSSLAGIGQGGPLAKIMDAVQGVGGASPSFGQFVGKALGGVDPKDVRARMAALRDLSPAAMAEAGITDQNRLAVMTERLGRVAAGFEDAKKVADPALRNQKLEALQAEADALTGNRESAKAQLTSELKAQGLGAADLKDVLAGRKGKFDDEGKARLAALSLASEKGIVATAADAGVAVGARVGQSDLDDIRNAQARMAKSKAAGNAKEAERHGGTAAEAIRSAVEGLLVDPDQVKALGAGGLGLVKSLRDDQLKLQAMADKLAGGDVGKLLASGNAEASAISGRIGKGVAEVVDRQDNPARRGVMNKDERELVDKHHAEITAKDEDKNKKAIDRLLKETGGDKLDEAQRGELARSLGAGRQGDTSRAALERGLDARSKLDAIAKAHGWDADDFRAAVRDGKGSSYSMWLGGDERKKIDALAKDGGSVLRAGKADEGTSFKLYKDSLEDVKRAKDDDVSGSKGTTKITGRVTIENGDMIFKNVRGEPAGGGSTPVAMT